MIACVVIFPFSIIVDLHEYRFFWQPFFISLSVYYSHCLFRLLIIDPYIIIMLGCCCLFCWSFLFPAGLLSLVLPHRSITDSSSSLALSSLLFLLIIIHQNSKGQNPFREALNSFCDEFQQKEDAPFQFSFANLYQATCKWATAIVYNLSLPPSVNIILYVLPVAVVLIDVMHVIEMSLFSCIFYRELHNEQTTLFLYQLLHGNSNFSSFVFSRTDIDLLVSSARLIIIMLVVMKTNLL